MCTAAGGEPAACGIDVGLAAAGGCVIGRTGGGGGTASAGFTGAGAEGCAGGLTGVAGFSGAFGTTSEGGRSAECAACGAGRILIWGCEGVIGVGTAAPQRVQYWAAGASVAPHFLQRDSIVVDGCAFSGATVVAEAAGATVADTVLGALWTRPSSTSSSRRRESTCRSRAVYRSRAAAASARRRFSIVNA